MYQPEQVKQKLAALAVDFGAKGKTADKAVTWEVIHNMENAWRTRPVKERTLNRRSVLRYLFGLDSTKSLTHAQLLALRHWMLFSKEREAELAAVLTAYLIECGQTQLPEPITGEQQALGLTGLYGNNYDNL